MFAYTAESAMFQGMDCAARRASLRRLVPAADLAPRCRWSQFVAWSGGLLGVVSAVVTCSAVPQFWRYRSRTGPAPSAGEAGAETAAGQVAEG